MSNRILGMCGLGIGGCAMPTSSRDNRCCGGVIVASDCEC